MKIFKNKKLGKKVRKNQYKKKEISFFSETKLQISKKIYPRDLHTGFVFLDLNVKLQKGENPHKKFSKNFPIIFHQKTSYNFQQKIDNFYPKIKTYRLDQLEFLPPERKPDQIRGLPILRHLMNARYLERLRPKL